MITIRNLYKKYNNVVLDDINLTLPIGKISILVGINGSGKTTLFECITGLKEYNSGSIEINGYSNNSSEFKEKLFYIPSDCYLPNYMTGKEYLEFVLKRYPRSKINYINEFVDLFNMTLDTSKLIESYSLGMKKKIQVIAAVLSNTDYILGDELFNGLDFETTLITMELLKEVSKNKGVILVSHNKLIIDKYAENTILLTNGRTSTFSGTSEELEKIILNMEGINEKIRFVQKYNNLI